MRCRASYGASAATSSHCLNRFFPSGSGRGRDHAETARRAWSPRSSSAIASFAIARAVARHLLGRLGSASAITARYSDERLAILAGPLNGDPARRFGPAVWRGYRGRLLTHSPSIAWTGHDFARSRSASWAMRGDRERWIDGGIGASRRRAAERLHRHRRAPRRGRERGPRRVGLALRGRTSRIHWFVSAICFARSPSAARNRIASLRRSAASFSPA